VPDGAKTWARWLSVLDHETSRWLMVAVAAVAFFATDHRAAKRLWRWLQAWRFQSPIYRCENGPSEAKQKSTEPTTVVDLPTATKTDDSATGDVSAAMSPPEQKPASEWFVQNLRRVIKVYCEAEVEFVKLARRVTRQAGRASGDPHKLLAELIENDAIQGSERGRIHHINSLEKFRENRSPDTIEAQEACSMLSRELKRIAWVGACLWRASSLVRPVYLVTEQYVAVYQQLSKLVDILDGLDGTDLDDLSKRSEGIKSMLREPRPAISLSDPRRNHYRNGARGGDDSATIRVTLGSGKELRTRHGTISGETVVEVDLDLVLEHPQPFLEGEAVRQLVAELEGRGS
jgi:hypothetical protein